jgi:uncharacterized membrane protein
MEIRKLPASAGAEWLLGGFGLLRRSPLGLGAMGALYGALALLLSLAAAHSVSLFMLLEVVLIVIGPLLVGGMVYAASRVDAGGRAEPGQLLQGVREGRVAPLLATLLPQIALTIAAVLLLVVVIGPQRIAEMGQLVERMQQQATPDPELLRGFPVGRLLLWLLLVFVAAIVTSFFTFIAVPGIMLAGNRAFAAMATSFRACVRNLPAMVVFFLLTMIAAMAVYIAVMLLGLVAALVGGPTAMQVVVQLLATAVLMPVVTGAMYFAWKQMTGQATAIAPSPADQIRA